MTITVFSAGAVKRGVAQIAKQYESASGETVAVEFDTAPNLMKRLESGETADVLVLPPAMLDALVSAGRAAGTPRGCIGRARIGMFVKRGSPRPDVSSLGGFQRAVREADALIYNRASSGLYIEALLHRLNLYDELAARIVKVDTGAAVMTGVAAHPGRALGAGQISEIRVQLDKGVAIEFAGPLPDEIQNATPYDAAAVGADAAAAAFVAALTSDAAKRLFAATGID